MRLWGEVNIAFADPVKTNNFLKICAGEGDCLYPPTTVITGPVRLKRA